MYDVLVINGHIMDGCGNPWFQADVGIADGRIVKIGNLQEEQSRETIDAGGHVVSPGFIDIHCHSDVLALREPRELGKILQGVTTEVAGNCGSSVVPVNPMRLQQYLKQASPTFRDSSVKWNWTSVGDYLDRIDEHRCIGNVATLVGHGMLRIAAMGFDDRQPTCEEMQTMKDLAKQSLEEGAFGLSSGLIYPPGIFSQEDEMIELCKTVAECGGFYATHLRNEGDLLLESVVEAIRVAEQAGIPLEISHHKAAGRSNWGKCNATLTMMEIARERGVEVTCDVYPYIAASTSLRTLLPPWMHDGGVATLLERLRDPVVQKRVRREIVDGLPGWENTAKTTGWSGVMLAYCPNNATCEGKTMQEVADLSGEDPVDVLFRLVLEEEGLALMNTFLMTEEDVKTILRHPLSMVGSDAIPSTGKPHPRFYGTFPRVLSKYVREERVLSLQEGVRKMTSMPAQKLGLRDRGVLKEGAWADVVVFDPDRIADKATFAEPAQHPEGIHYVLVNGMIAVRKGQYIGSLSGRSLRRGWL